MDSTVPTASTAPTASAAPTNCPFGTDYEKKNCAAAPTFLILICIMAILAVFAIVIGTSKKKTPRSRRRGTQAISPFQSDGNLPPGYPYIQDRPPIVAEQRRSVDAASMSTHRSASTPLPVYALRDNNVAEEQEEDAVPMPAVPPPVYSREYNPWEESLSSNLRR